jgi:hypothetical protein
MMEKYEKFGSDNIKKLLVNIIKEYKGEVISQEDFLKQMNKI